MISEEKVNTLDINGIIRQIVQLLKAGQVDNAIAFCQQNINQRPHNSDLKIVLSHAYQQKGLFDEMLVVTEEACEIDKNHFAAQCRLIECLIYCSEMALAIKTIDNLAQDYNDDATKLAKIAELYLHAGQHQKVAKTHKRALELQPQNPAFMYNLAAALINTGEIEQSKTLLDKLINIAPHDFDAYSMRSGLAKASKEHNHSQELKQLLQQNNTNSKATIALGFALAKELEDLGDYQQSWHYLAKANAARRKQMRYQVSNDINAIDTIIKTTNQQNLNKNETANNKQNPIFILGLPRSGSTLTDRMLSSHPQVASLGEHNAFAFALMHCVGEHQGKKQLIEKSLKVNFDCLADKYSQATQGYGFKQALLIDKTPLNFLYLGLIKKAFPQAKIIHIYRHPMDACYAIYKTLFRMGYPFSYDLEDLGRYFIAYTKLMKHWQRTFKDSFYPLKYEDLVNNPENTAKNLLDYCQLKWNPKVLAMHKNTAPTATASAVQVRQGIYTSSVHKWKNYAQQLQPLKTQLEQAGIRCE
jgi:tetratricopeptide (TPR) repeat protein